MIRRLESGIPKERMNCGKSQITTADRQALALLQIIQKRADQRGIDLFEPQACWWLMQPLVSELQKLPKSIAI
jgi:hypothetical protein